MKRTKIASEALSEPELSAVLNAALPDPRLYRMILLAVTHGLRAEELCKLRPGDVSGGFLLIRHFKTKEVDQHSLTPEEKCLLSTWIPASPLSLFGMPYATFYYKFRGLAERCALPQSKQSHLRFWSMLTQLYLCRRRDRMSASRRVEWTPGCPVLAGWRPSPHRSSPKHIEKRRPSSPCSGGAVARVRSAQSSSAARAAGVGTAPSADGQHNGGSTAASLRSPGTLAPPPYRQSM